MRKRPVGLDREVRDRRANASLGQEASAKSFIIQYRFWGRLKPTTSRTPGVLGSDMQRRPLGRWSKPQRMTRRRLRSKLQGSVNNGLTPPL